MIRRFIPILISAAFTLFLFSCQTSRVSLETPEGFAEITDTGYYFHSTAEPYRAISPEGMMLRVRVVDNYPPKKLDFWAETLQIHMEKSGYQPTGEAEEFTAGDHSGILLTWAVPYNRQVFIYLTAILIADENIIVIESAGEHSIYSKYESDIRKSLSTLALETVTAP